MQSSGLSRQPGAINQWRKLVLESDRMLQVLHDITKFAEKYTLVPDRKDIFNMFRMLRPSEVKVVIVAQSPYPGCCPATRIPYACGPAFLPTPGCTTTPATLRAVVSEVYRDLACNKARCTPSDLVLDWVDQGVMLLNASLTLGKDCPKYLEDHSVVWEEVMREIISVISDNVNPIFVLVGKDAWKFDSIVNNAIKVSHPVARKGTWAGSGVFSAVSNMMIERGQLPIRWSF